MQLFRGGHLDLAYLEDGFLDAHMIRWLSFKVHEMECWPNARLYQPNVMMTSSNGKITALLALCAENSPTTSNSPHKGHWRGTLMFSLICAWINVWVKNREADDLRCHRAHYDVTVMLFVRVMAWWHQVTNHYPKQWWLVLIKIYHMASLNHYD